MLSYKVTRLFSFVLSAWLILIVGNSVAPSLHEDSFVVALLLPWYGPRELVYLVFNVGVVMILAGLGAKFYGFMREEPRTFTLGFLLILCIGSFVYGAVIIPSEYLFLDGRSIDSLEALGEYASGQLGHKFVIMAVMVFGVMTALLALLVEYLFYTLPRMGHKGKVATASGFRRPASTTE